MTIASNADIPSFPAIPAAYSAFWASDSFANPSLASPRSSRRETIFPLLSVKDKDRSSMYPCICSVGFARFVRAALNAVPAFSPLIFAFAINPAAIATSSYEYLSAPATGATYSRVPPSPATSVLEAAAAWASTSANRAASLAFFPNAVSVPVTISEDRANPSPDAAARYITPGRPSNICCVVHPADAMYSNPCPASSAVNWVVSPISFARLVSFRISASEACEIACTVLIWLSKPIPVIVAAPSAAVIPNAADLLPFTIASNARSDTLARLLIPFTLMPPKESPIFCADSPAFFSRWSISLRALLIDASKDRSVPPAIMISNSYFFFLSAICHRLFLLSFFIISRSCLAVSIVSWT